MQCCRQTSIEHFHLKTQWCRDRLRPPAHWCSWALAFLLSASHELCYAITFSILNCSALAYSQLDVADKTNLPRLQRNAEEKNSSLQRDTKEKVFSRTSNTMLETEIRLVNEKICKKKACVEMPHGKSCTKRRKVLGFEGVQWALNSSWSAKRPLSWPQIYHAAFGNFVEPMSPKCDKYASKSIMSRSKMVAWKLKKP